jgi:hypothetical protein
MISKNDKATVKRHHDGKTERFNRYGNLHSFNKKPSVRYREDGNVIEEWHNNGRLLGKRVTEPDGYVELRDANGQYHSLYGLPAHVDEGESMRYRHGVPHGLMEFNNGEKEYWINGKPAKNHKLW